jgi:hypothetical protein
MAEGGRSESAMPMSVDSGNAGLEQSRHHPNAGISEHAAYGRRDDGEAEKRGEEADGGADGTVAFWKRQLKAVVTVKEGMEEAWTAFLRERVANPQRTRRVSDASNHIKTLQKEVSALTGAVKEIKGLITRPTPATSGSTTPATSWASVVAGGTPAQPRYASAAMEPRLVVPARRAREVIIRATDQSEAMQARTPVEIVRAVNTALSGEEAVAARRLRVSGDVVLTFREGATKYKANEEWIKGAFGATARPSRREYTLVAKGLNTSRLKDAHCQPGELLTELQKTNTTEITRITPRLPKNDRVYAALIIGVSSEEAATSLCRDGLVWEAQIFTCEPYVQGIEVVRCFNCQKFGHIGKYCTKPAKCARCGLAAHEGGETACPRAAYESSKRFQCANCHGPHPAYSPRCPAAREQRDRANLAYVNRPRQFEFRTAATGPAPTSILQRAHSEEDGWQTVQPRKRHATSREVSQTRNPVGRPRGGSRTAQGTTYGANIVNLLSARSTPASSLLAANTTPTAESQDTPM